MTDENLNTWMDEARLPSDLPGGKGIVSTIQAPKPIETKFGSRKACQIVLTGSDGSQVNTKLFLPEQFPMIHPKSNLGKMLAKYGCKKLQELIGKEVDVISTGDMMWKISTE